MLVCNYLGYLFPVKPWKVELAYFLDDLLPLLGGGVE